MAPELDSHPVELEERRPLDGAEEGGLPCTAAPDGAAGSASRVSTSSRSSSGVRHWGQKPPLSRGSTMAPQVGHATMFRTGVAIMLQVGCDTCYVPGATCYVLLGRCCVPCPTCTCNVRRAACDVRRSGQVAARGTSQFEHVARST